MSYRPYPKSKLAISYGSRHKLPYMPPIVRGYGVRSPFQTGSGAGDKVNVANGIGIGVVTSGNTSTVSANVGMGLTTSSNNIVTLSSQYFASIENDGQWSTSATWITIPIKISTVGASSGASVTSNQLNVTAGNVYFVVFSATNQIQVNSSPEMGLRVKDGGGNVFLTSQGQSNGMNNPYTYSISGFVVPVSDGLLFDVFNTAGTVNDMTASVMRIK